MRHVLSSHFISTEALQNFYGLAQVTSLPGGSKTHLAFECLSVFLKADPPAPSKQLNTNFSYFAFISDEGSVYPPALHALGIPLSRVLIIKTTTPEQVWKTGLESLQTGLFSFIFLRPSKICPTAHLRKLQLSSERKKAKVFVLSDHKLPHWTLKASLIAKQENTKSIDIS
ncbi:MAG: hypothetical protein EXR74_04695 [Bdellovibrionales bacterium]|nr:hypothetical protein [Bdellovibrionales bacterium]